MTYPSPAAVTPMRACDTDVRPSAPRRRAACPLSWVLLACLFAACIAPAAAQLRADLSLRGTLHPGTALDPGGTATLTLTFRNDGPSAVAATALGGIDIGPNAPYSVFALPTTAPCSLHVGGFEFPERPSRFHAGNAILQLPLLAPGESRTCAVGVRIADDATGPLPLGFTVYGNASPFVDPNPANDSARFQLVLSPLPIPAGGAFGGVLLGALLLAAARRHRPNRTASVFAPHISTATRSPGAGR